MEFFVPIYIQEEFKGKYHGRVPCVPDHRVAGNSRNQVAVSLYTDISHTIQNTKDPRIFRTFLKKPGEGNYDYVKIDFFSRSEHILFSTILFLVTATLFLIVSTLVGYAFYLFFPVGERAFSSDNRDFIATQYIWFHFLQAVLYVALFNVIYTYYYPSMTNFLAQIILDSRSFRIVYKLFISCWLRAWSGKRLQLDWEKKNAKT